jgi:hypothetical protein
MKECKTDQDCVGLSNFKCLNNKCECSEEFYLNENNQCVESKKYGDCH